MWLSQGGTGEAGQAGLGLASLNNFSVSAAQGLSLVVCYRARGDYYRQTVAQSVTAL